MHPLPVPDAAAPALHAALTRFAAAADGAFAANSRRAVASDLRIFAEWCAGRGLPTVPAAPEAVAEFLAAMAETRAVATVRRYAASIALLHRAAGYPPPTQTTTVRLALKRLARLKGTRQVQALGLTEATIGAILDAAGTTVIDRRDVALVLVARDLLARRRELVALDVADVARQPDGSGRVLVARSKTDQAAAGAVLYLSPRAMAAVTAWCTAAGITSGPLFRSVRRNGRVGGRLPDGEVPRLFRKLMAAAGLPSDGVSGHSCRVGMAQDLVAAGATLAELMQAGRWKSPAMPARYAENQLAGQGAVARFHRRDGAM